MLLITGEFASYSLWEEKEKCRLLGLQGTELKNVFAVDQPRTYAIFVAGVNEIVAGAHERIGGRPI